MMVWACSKAFLLKTIIPFYHYYKVKTYPLAEAWDFFSSSLNRAKITPPQMRFNVTSNQTADSKIYPGMILIYTVSPLTGIKLNWTTEITQVKYGEYFVAEQRVGPYALMVP
jgi:ligand-binding SRPBCC domain-containing protein